MNLRNTLIRTGAIRPCVPTPLVKNERGQWVVGITSYGSTKR